MSQKYSFLCPLWGSISDVSFRVHLKQRRGCRLQERWITEVSCLRKIFLLWLQHLAQGLFWRLRDKDCLNTFHSVIGNSCHLFLANHYLSSFPFWLWGIHIFWLLANWRFWYNADRSTTACLCQLSMKKKTQTTKNPTHFSFCYKFPC